MMKNPIGWLAALSLVTFPTLAQEQHHEEQRQHPEEQRGGRPQEGPRPNAPVGHGFIPARGPQPIKQSPPKVIHQGAPVAGQPDPAHHAFHDRPEHPEIPHVHPNNTWVGHNTGRTDMRYHLDHPWARGHFPLGFGPRYVYRLRGGAPQRFAIEGQFFEVAVADLELASDWDWDNDNVVLYADPDHEGFYLAYNSRLGTYVHVEFLGT
jgi:hypothetical protein